MTETLQQLFDDDGAGGAALAALAREHIQSDATTIIRVAAEISTRGRFPGPAITRACTEEVALLTELERTIVTRELEQVLVGRNVDEALQWLQEIGAVALLLPELEATVNLNQEGGRRHKDVWEHTKLVVKQAVRRPAVRWAALLHDIGKVPTRTFTNKGVHFHGHAEVGARMFDKMSRRISFDRPTRRKIRFLIQHHLRSNQYSSTWTDSAVRRFDRDMGEHLVDLLDLSRADITSKRPGRRAFLLRQIHELAQRVEQLRVEDAKLPPLHPGVGNTIMEAFGIPPSRRIGELKRAIEAAIEAGSLEPRQPDVYYITWLRESGLVDAATASAGSEGSTDIDTATDTDADADVAGD